MDRATRADRAVPLPPGLTVAAVKRAIDRVERELAEFGGLHFQPTPLLRALIWGLAAKSLDAETVYKKRRYGERAQSCFPDLKRRGSGPNPPSEHCLECKASKRPWAVQSHYDHPGWYIIWRYLVDPTCSLERGRPVIIWRVEVAFFGKSDWKYGASRAGATGGGRTHTFGIQNPASKLKDKAVYARSDVHVSGSKAIPRNGA